MEEERNPTDQPDLKGSVKEHWERETCGTWYAEASDRSRYFAEVSEARYRLEPYIRSFADFPSATGKRVLEIGVGAGADFEQWCEYASHATGIDLTEAAIRLTCERMALRGVSPERYTLRSGDAEDLPFETGSFDLVWSWGVLHHTPRTEAAIAEVHRVLVPGGEFRGMVYHHPSWTGLMLTGEHMVRRRSLRPAPRRAAADLLESPGTKVYRLSEAQKMLAAVGFRDVHVSSILGPGDLLTVQPSERYQGAVMQRLWRLYPRVLVRRTGGRFGMNLLMSAKKASV